jgi:hypothetical protein
MIELTAPNNSKTLIDGTRVYRIRASLPSEGSEVRSRIDWAILSLVKETLDKVVPLVRTELPSLTVLTALDDAKIWFDAKEAVGPLPIIPQDQASGFNSKIEIRGVTQYVIETPDQVRAVISAAGGTPL